MKILIAYQYFSFKGGLEHVMQSQAELLIKNGYDVGILTSDYLVQKNNRRVRGAKQSCIRCWDVLYKRFGIPFAIPCPTLSNLRSINAALDNSDIVNIQGHPYLFSFVVTLLAKRKHKPVILTQHNTKIKTSNLALDLAYRLLDYTIGRYNISKADKIIAGSKATKLYVTNLVPSKENQIVTIYNGIDSKVFKPVKSKNKLRDRFSIPRSKFVCFTIRRFTFKNGIDILLQAINMNNDNGILFIIGGSGPDLEKAKAFVINNKLTNVLLLGHVNDSDLPKYYAMSDAFILPSRQGEGFPMVVLEAFASGIPVIATKSGGHVEIIKNGKNGFLVDLGKPNEINQKIAALQKKDLLVIAKECRELVKSSFTWEVNKNRLIQVINEVAS